MNQLLSRRTAFFTFAPEGKYNIFSKKMPYLGKNVKKIKILRLCGSETC